MTEAHLSTFGSKFIRTIHDGLVFVTALMTHDFLKELIETAYVDLKKIGAVVILIVVTTFLNYLMKKYVALDNYIHNKYEHLDDGGGPQLVVKI